MSIGATYLGTVRKVTGATVFVEISADIPSANPIINGRVHRLGQIGSFVRIPVGYLNLYGIVAMVGVSEAKQNDEDESITINFGNRWIEVVGQIATSTLQKRCCPPPYA